VTPPPPPRPGSEQAEPTPATIPASEARPERICPTCGATLLERKCKLLCPDPACGYYLSCSDFY